MKSQLNSYKDLSNLAYLPLDLPKTQIPYKNLIKLFNNQAQPHHPYPSLWHSVTVTGDIENFQDPLQCDRAWKNRYNKDKKSIKVNSFIPFDTLNLLLKQISLLPYKTCVFSQILSQQSDIPPHKDGPYKNRHCLKMALKENPIDFGEQSEPAGLKVLLSHTSVRSLYVLKNVKSRRQFIKLPKATASFAINERTFFHGAKAPKKPKFILSTFGIIDKDKHKKLIQKSLRKYSDEAIWF